MNIGYYLRMYGENADKAVIKIKSKLYWLEKESSPFVPGSKSNNNMKGENR